MSHLSLVLRYERHSADALVCMPSPVLRWGDSWKLWEKPYSLLLSDPGWLCRSILWPRLFMKSNFLSPLFRGEGWSLGYRVGKPPTSEVGTLAQHTSCLVGPCLKVSLLFQLSTVTSLNRPNRLAQRRYPTQPCWEWPSVPGSWEWPPTHPGLMRMTVCPSLMRETIYLSQAQDHLPILGAWKWPPAHPGFISRSTTFLLLSSSQYPTHLVIFRHLLWTTAQGVAGDKGQGLPRHKLI